MKCHAPLMIGLSAAALGLAIACSSKPANPADDAPQAAALAAVSPETIEKGRALYKANCAGCHGDGGRGDGPAAGVLKPPPRDHTDAEYMATMTDEEMGNVIRFGGAMKGKPLMPSHPQINGPDLDALIAFTRSLSAAKPAANEP